MGYIYSQFPEVTATETQTYLLLQIRLEPSSILRRHYHTKYIKIDPESVFINTFKYFIISYLTSQIVYLKQLTTVHAITKLHVLKMKCRTGKITQRRTWLFVLFS